MTVSVGDRFTRWVVTGQQDREHVLCRCDCGIERPVQARNLSSGRSRSCGCLAREETADRNRHQRLKYPISPGDTFGRLSVLDAADRTKVKCRCACGTLAVVNASHLASGAIRSCGCLMREATSRRFLKYQVSDGDVFGRLTVLDAADRQRVTCRCECGSQVVTRADSIGSGHARSCGCLQRDVATISRTTHGLSDDPLYGTWHAMMSRCADRKDPAWPRYGGRGIGVCERWSDAAAFLADIYAAIGPRPDGMTLDRIDNDGNYESGNVRWATRKQQAANRRPSRRRKFSPERVAEVVALANGGMTQKAVADRFGMSQPHVSTLVREAALRTP